MPDKLSSQRMKSYGRRLGVAIEPFGDLGWIVPPRDPEKTPPISITEHAGNILLNVLPVVTLANAKMRPEAMEELLRLNASHPLAQYALAEDWQVLLWVACPAESFTFQLFERGLKAMQQALSEDLERLQGLS